jgi:crotonobetainyl-CoA:carnitine CoA-transferase CaiB-like acyl-CoA transferase
LGNAHPNVTPYQPMRARDKTIIVAVGNERLWQRFCKILGVENTLMRDTRFATNAARNVNRAALIALLEGILSERDGHEWVDALVADGIPAGPINFPDETLTDEHFVARKMIVELEHPLIGAVRSIALPIHFSATGPTYRRYPPRLGEHNAPVREAADSW